MRQGVERAAHPISRFAWRVERAVRAYGVTGAARRGWVALRSVRAERRNGDRDPFDDEMGVSTAGIVRLESLSVPSETRQLGVRYQPSDPETLRRTIAELPIRYEEFVFVDFGSGKGRALLVASEFPFERIVGIEFAEELHEIARAEHRRVFESRAALQRDRGRLRRRDRVRASRAAARPLLLQPVPRARDAAGDGERRRLARGRAPAGVRRAVAEHAARGHGGGGGFVRRDDLGAATGDQIFARTG